MRSPELTGIGSEWGAEMVWPVLLCAVRLESSQSTEQQQASSIC